MNHTPYDHIANQFCELRIHLQPKEEEYLALVLDPLKEGSTVLDLGCGTGTPIAREIAVRGHHIVGVDGSAAMLALAQESLPGHRWIHSLMENVEFEESFDAVICWDSLFHLPRTSYAQILGKIHRWLLRGGRMMVSSGGMVESGEGFVDTMFGHEFFYDSLPPAQMVSVMEELGFEIIISEMCDQPDGGRNKGKWAIVASRNV